MSIRPKWTPPVPDGEPLPYTVVETDVEKSGVLTPSFGSKTKRRNQLVQRLKRSRMYGPPVRGGKTRKKGRLGGHLSSGRSATTLRGMKTSFAKHPGPAGSDTHSTGTDQSVHAPHTISGKASDKPELARENFNHNEEYFRAWRSLPELGEHQYWTRPGKMEDLQKRLDKLNRRGQRYLGIPESEALKIVKLDQTHAHTASDGRVIAFQAIEIQGTPPEAPGFKFLAKLEHLQNEDGTYTNILKANPNFESEIPVEYRNAGPDCDICKRKVYRKETFLVKNVETGEVVQAGRDDLVLYTGFREADQLASYTSGWADFVADLNEGGPSEGGGGYGPLTFSAKDALAVTASLTRQEGFIPARSYDGTPTKVWLGEILRAPHKLDPQMRHLLPEEQDYEKGEKVLDWLQSLEDDDLANDYMWNLKVAATNPYGVDDRTFGIIASAVSAYDKEMGFRVERERKVNIDAKSDWVGEVKVRQDFKDLTITRHNSFEGTYGVTHVYEFLDNDDNAIVWFASNPIEQKVQREMPEWARKAGTYTEDEFYENVPLEIGAKVSLKATVKEHKLDTFNDRNRKQTVITRGKVIE